MIYVYFIVMKVVLLLNIWLFVHFFNKEKSKGKKVSAEIR